MFEQVEGGQQWTLTPEAQLMCNDCVYGYVVVRNAMAKLFPGFPIPEHKSIDEYYEDLTVATNTPVPASMQEEFKQRKRKRNVI